MSLGCALLAFGCKQRDAELMRSAAVSSAAPVAKKKTEPQLYDVQGRLLASKQRVDWLEIPVTFTRQMQGEYGRHVIYESVDAPFEKVRSFLSERMLTGRVDETPRAVSYRAVMPIDGRDVVRLDVTLTRLADTRVQLDIERLSYDGIKPLSVEDAKKALREDAKRAE